MDPVSFAGMVAPAVMDYFGADEQNRVNSARTAEARQFTIDMARSGHQYEMEDLERAGLNPLLTGKYGGSSGGGNPGVIPAVNALSQGVSSAQHQRRLDADLESIRLNNQNTKLQGEKIRADTDLTRQDTLLRPIQAFLSQSSGELNVASAKKVKEQTLGQQIENYLQEKEKAGASNKSNFDSSGLGKFLYKVNRVSDVIGNSFNSAKRAANFARGFRK